MAVTGLLDRFDPIDIDVNGNGICGRMAGSGPPILMLHGYPQTHVMWHQVAPALAEWAPATSATPAHDGDAAARPAPNGTTTMLITHISIASDLDRQRQGPLADSRSGTGITGRGTMVLPAPGPHPGFGRTNDPVFRRERSWSQ